MATTFEKERKLTEDIVPRVAHDVPGVDVLAVELLSPSRFCVYVDHADGVDHALCERVTDVLRDYLREYSVEVSSPGVDRPLFTPAQFARFAGETAKVGLKLPQDGRRRLQGTISRVEGDRIVFEVDGVELPVAFDNIDKAKLVPDWAALGFAPVKPGKDKPAKGGPKGGASKAKK